ncbi:MAG TPA: type II toxin-antitoxin system RelE/ParE family toxin [Candidatus Tyrphobacter sp.]
MVLEPSYSDEALEDLWHIWFHHAEGAGISAADAFEQRLKATIYEVIVKFPESGRSRPELGSRVRSYPVLPYLIFYEPLEGHIKVLRVLHGHRDIKEPLMSLLLAG